MVPATGLLKLIALVTTLLQNTWFATAFTEADGLTVMVNVIGVPLQFTPPLLNTGVTVIVAVTALVVLFTAVNDGIFPVPLAAKPMDVVLLTQLKLTDPPVALVVKLTAVVAAPLHNVWLLTAFTLAVGITVMVNVVDGPAQLTPPLVKVGVTVIVAVTGAVPLFTAVKAAIFPVPLAAKPIDVFVLVQA